MKKQLTTDQEIWQCVLAGSTVLESSVHGDKQITLVHGNVCYNNDPEQRTDIARQVRKYYEVTE